MGNHGESRSHAGQTANSPQRMSRNLPAALLLLVAFVVVAGCAAPAADRDASVVQADTPHRIYVVRHGWHSGIVVPAAKVPADAWLARRQFAAAEYFEVGWGDRAYYQAVDPSPWLGLRALLWPTPGVLHIVAFSGPVEQIFGAIEILELRVSAHGLDRLVQMVRDSHELDAAGRQIAFGPGQYGTSRFYASREKFHLFKTCNVWTATLLRQAGVQVAPAQALLVGNLMAQLRPKARVVRPAP
jgi:uncharacterized protein (TIGR02117 family)